MRSTTSRIAVVLAALFAIAAIAIILVPVSSDGAECGSLVSPDWTEEQVDDMVDRSRDLAERDFTGQYSGQAFGLAVNARDNGRACDQSRSTRWVLVGVAGGLAVIAPAAVLFIGGARRNQDSRGRS